MKAAAESFCSSPLRAESGGINRDETPPPRAGQRGLNHACSGAPKQQTEEAKAPRRKASIGDGHHTEHRQGTQSKPGFLLRHRACLAHQEQRKSGRYRPKSNEDQGDGVRPSGFGLKQHGQPEQGRPSHREQHRGPLRDRAVTLPCEHQPCWGRSALQRGAAQRSSSGTRRHKFLAA